MRQRRVSEKSLRPVQRMVVTSPVWLEMRVIKDMIEKKLHQKEWEFRGLFQTVVS